MTSSIGTSPTRVHGSSRQEANIDNRSISSDKKSRSVEQQFVEIIETERRRLGREFHDGLGQRLTSLALSAAILSQKLEMASRPEVLDARRLVSQIDETVREARSLVRGLYPAWLSQNGLENTLSELLERVNDVSGRTAQLVVGTTWNAVTDRDDAMHIFRVVQEAVNNALKHSECQRISVTLERNGERRRVEIADDGRGITDSQTNGFGFRLMQYRAELLGGRLSISSPPGGGTTVELAMGRADVTQ